MHHGTSGDSWDTCPLYCWVWARRQLGKLAHLKYNMCFLARVCVCAHTRPCCAGEQHGGALSKPYCWSVLEQVIECLTSYGSSGSWPFPTSCCREDGTGWLRKVGFRQKLCCSCRDRYHITPPKTPLQPKTKQICCLEPRGPGVSWELNKPEVCHTCLYECDLLVSLNDQCRWV